MRKTILALTLVLAALPSWGSAQSQDELMAGLERLAERGNAEAIYHLGMAFHTGSGVDEDPAKALEFFRQATALGDPLAAYKLGCYYDGQGGDLVEDDLELALKYKMRAADAGYALAQQDVATLLARKGDFQSAVGWLERAVSQGWSGALVTYASIHNGAEGVANDPVKVAAYFRIFINRTDASSKQLDWLKEFEQNMTSDQRKAADQIVRSFIPDPTELTLKALAGRRTAEVLVSEHGAI